MYTSYYGKLHMMFATKSQSGTTLFVSFIIKRLSLRTFDPTKFQFRWEPIYGLGVMKCKQISRYSLIISV